MVFMTRPFCGVPLGTDVPYHEDEKDENPDTPSPEEHMPTKSRPHYYRVEDKRSQGGP